MARVKDVLDDDWKVKPVSLLLGGGACILGVMIVINTFSQGKTQAANGVTGQPGEAAATVVLRYDPMIEDVQRELLAQGLYKGAVDGVNGLRTKQAIQDYQRANGLSPNGDASAELINHMRFTRKVQQAAEFTGSVAPTAPQANTTVPKADTGVKKVQVALAGLGYEINTLDGMVNGETRAAILKFEMDNGLDMDGKVDDELLKALKVQ